MHSRGSFRVFTNPLEMESFFTEQFDDMLKMFGFGHFAGPGFFRGNVHPGELPFLEEAEEEPGSREFILKKDDRSGYILPDQLKERRDTEIDQVSPDDLDKLYSPDYPKQPKINPWFHEGQDYNRVFSFGQSFSSQTIQMPDGSIEELKTVKDNEGRETITVTKKNNEECLTITTIRHPDGREERHESNECPQIQQFRSTMRQFNNGNSISDSIIDKWRRF